jgi:3-hydroxymyristoyl/3-hydroxydecanoyl-(acyl carrier protein) dehydratase
LIAEALAQLAGIAGAGSATRQGALVHVDVRFESAVTPPASIALSAKLTRRLGAIQQYEVVATLDNRSIARGSLSLHLAGDDNAPA